MNVFASSLDKKYLKRITSISLTRYQLILTLEDRIIKHKYLNAIKVAERWISNQAPKTDFKHEAEYTNRVDS